MSESNSGLLLILIIVTCGLLWIINSHIELIKCLIINNNKKDESITEQITDEKPKEKVTSI